MKAFEARTTIAAPPERVWPVLVDAPAWPSWDSGVVRVEGSVEPGARLTVVSSANPGRAFPVRVAELTRPRVMRWIGGMPLGLFTGERIYTLTGRQDGTTEVHVREAYRGPLAGLIGRSIPDLEPSMRQFVSGLKARVEGTA